MCGIAGLALSSGNSRPPLTGAIERMVQHMNSRGPDASRVSDEDGMLFGHCRLAILDLDPRSHQPMTSASGRYTVVYNGEIYNFRDLRAELESEGAVFRTTSDTEVLLALFQTEGAAMLRRLRGMFAFVIWDRVAKRGFAARDPYGIKPLYYAQSSEGLAFASQVKALLETGLISRDPDLRGQAGFWLLGSVSEPYTWYRDIRALQAGHYAWIEDGHLESPVSWWNISDVWSDGHRTKLKAPEIRERVRAALLDSVRAHLVADVPVGVFLSGGIDSGALAGLMIEAGAQSLKGFTLSFREFEGKHEDEAPVARRLASHYGIEHHIREVTREEFQRDLPRILRAMDQPSIDGINTWYASKAVAEHGFKVVVSGVGGDELFQGYSSFRQLPRMVAAWQPFSKVPGAMFAAALLANVKARRSGNLRWKHMPDWARTMEGAWWLRRGLFSPEDLPALMGEERAHEALSQFHPDTWISPNGASTTDLRMSLSRIESTHYLRNQLLRDSDWASMDHSVELRTPLVDAWLLRDLSPLLPQFASFPGKTLLAEAPRPGLPPDVIRRRKTGFGIPVDRWVKTEAGSFGLRSWARFVSEAYDTDTAQTP